jgi:hypothetical protein
MELRTQPLDRVLEALSPALAIELERLIGETRQALEAEFQQRLQAAVQEAETASQRRADQELERAVREAQDTVRQQITHQLNAEFSKAIEEKSNQLQQLQSEWASERALLQEQAQRWRIFADAQQQLAEASSQPEILSRFMRLAEPFAPALAIYTSKADGLALWKRRGEHAFPQIISEQTRDPETYFRQVVVRGKAVGAVAAAGECKTEALDFMVGAMERAIEIFGLRLRAPVQKPPRVSRQPDLAVANRAQTAAAGVPPRPAEAESDEVLHTEARKVARLLVSEIKLYNEQGLKEGRANADIYVRLQKEIDQGRASYNDRLQGTSTGGHDYYHEELVRILAENDERLMGNSYPGAR